MIPIPSGVRVWIATGHTDMRRGMQGLALTVQESLKRDPHAGDLYIFRGRRGDLAKILWHDGIGLSLYAKRLDRGKFIWPSASSGAVSISAAQMAYMLEGIDWRAPAEPNKILDHVHFRAPQITEFMILSFAWTRLATLFPTT
jgi:transposase